MDTRNEYEQPIHAGKHHKKYIKTEPNISTLDMNQHLGNKAMIPLQSHTLTHTHTHIKTMRTQKERNNKKHCQNQEPDKFERIKNKPKVHTKCTVCAIEK